MSFDKIEQATNSLFAQFFLIFCISIFCLIGIRLLLYVLNRSNPSPELETKKIRYSILVTLLISNWMYGSYSIEIVDQVFNENRRYVRDKIEIKNGYPEGSIGENLTGGEFNELAKRNWFPSIDESARNVSYTYTHDGFLPDYGFHLTYEVPESVEIEVILDTNGTYNKTQTFTLVRGHKGSDF